MELTTVRHEDTGMGFQKILIRTNGTEHVAPRTSVWASVAEGHMLHTFIGDARIYVAAVSAGAGEVWVQVQVDWHVPLPFVVTLFILDT